MSLQVPVKTFTSIRRRAVPLDGGLPSALFLAAPASSLSVMAESPSGVFPWRAGCDLPLPSSLIPLVTTNLCPYSWTVRPQATIGKLLSALSSSTQSTVSRV